MNKFLHERLREVKVEACSKAVTFVGRTCVEFDSCEDCYKAICSSLADEIERFYIPRLRYEDGEPVQFGDETNMQEAIEAMLFKADGSFELHQNSRNEFKVRSTDPFEVIGLIVGVSSTWFKPEEFTHKEPDSFEKLRDEMTRKRQALNAPSMDELETWVDRLTALMERSA